MPNAEKVGTVAEIAERFNNASAAVITEYRGLSVKQVTDLRRALGRDTTYAVVKNTLTRRAAAEAGVVIDENLLVGPTAIAFVTGDPVEAAKGLRDFARTNPLLVIKGGILDGRSLSAAEVGRIADLESREVLLSKLAGAIKALPAKAAGLFQAPLTQMALLAKALEDKRSAQAAEAPVASASPGTTDASAAAADEAPAADQAPAEVTTETTAEASTEASTEATAEARTIPTEETTEETTAGPAE